MVTGLSGMVQGVISSVKLMHTPCSEPSTPPVTFPKENSELKVDSAENQKLTCTKAPSFRPTKLLSRGFLMSKPLSNQFYTVWLWFLCSLLA